MLSQRTSWQRLRLIEDPNVPCDRDQKSNGDADDGHRAAHIKQSIVLPEDRDLWIGRSANVPAASTRRSSVGPNAPERQPEHRQAVGREVNLDRQHEVCDEKRHGDERRHIAGPRETRQDKEHAKTIDDVIDVKTVARPLLPADAGNRSVEAVAKPIELQVRRWP